MSQNTEIQKQDKESTENQGSERNRKTNGTEEVALPKNYRADEIEERWRDEWLNNESLYSYDDESDAPDYIIDTPPPYPTGKFHIGNSLGWCYMDFIARYKRLQGFNVLFPQGWDCHGLPTEVKVEEKHGIKKSEVGSEEFRELCMEHTYEMIDEFKDTMTRLGFSQDWSYEYTTMEPEYWGKTQRSFIEMAEKDYVYRDYHPVNWCPRCETAIADAEVESEKRNREMIHMGFDLATESNETIEIASTRPELLMACDAIVVHPDDSRYTRYIGETARVPIFGQEVEIIADDDVDPEFGSGAVMVCTFGDKQDVEWWARHDLELRQAFTEDGKIAEAGGKYAGTEIDEAREDIISDLEEGGYVIDEERVEQNIGVCWRCDTPIELLAREQWFVEVNKDEILGRAQEVDWLPEHMYDRLEDWTEGMDWDWVISRQRVFATPIPAWYCDECGQTHLASPEELPVNPSEEDPSDECHNCGSESFTPETDVMDTWMDSSISPLHVMGWPENEFETVDLREQGHEIIRTWAFYTLLRTSALTDEKPWEEALINGMVLDAEGKKMSKSGDNSVSPREVVEEHSADALRQALASGGKPGADIQFEWKEAERASKFQTKLWNLYRLIHPHLNERNESEKFEDVDETDLRLSDKWILSKLTKLVDEVEDAMEDRRFDLALRKIRSFVWEDVADNYVEITKDRLYMESEEGYEAARYTLRTLIENIAVILAPIAPFITEEIHIRITGGSVHEAEWPDIDHRDPDAERDGELQAEIVEEVRRWKSNKGIALNTDIGDVEIYTETSLDEEDISNALKAEVDILNGKPEIEEIPTEVEADMSILGPKYGSKADKIATQLEEMDEDEIQRWRHEKLIEIEGEEFEYRSETVEIKTEKRHDGDEVNVIEIGGDRETTILI